MLIKTNLFNNTFNILKIKRIESKILSDDKETESKVQEVVESTLDYRVKSIVKPFTEISQTRVLDTTYDEFYGHIYLLESIFFDNTDQENITVVTPIEATFKNKFLLTNLIDYPIAVLNRSYLDSVNSDSYIEFDFSLKESEFYNYLNNYFKTVGMNLENIKNIRFYKNLSGYFLSSYLFGDSGHLLACSKMEEDFPGIRCDHLFRNTEIPGEILYSYLNQGNSILKLYKVGEDYKIYGKITFGALKSLYNELKTILNNKYNRMLNNTDLNTDVDSLVKSLDLPYFQIPIGFDIVFEVYKASNMQINLKIQSYILFDLFESVDLTGEPGKIEVLNNFVLKEINLYPYNITINSLIDQTTNVVIPMTFILNNASKNTVDLIFNDITNYNPDITYNILPGNMLDSTGINLPFNVKLLGLNNSGNYVYKFNKEIKYIGNISTSSVLKYKLNVDNTEYLSDVTVNIIKEPRLGRLKLTNEQSTYGSKIFVGYPVKSIFKLSNIHQNTVCRINKEVIKCFLVDGANLIPIDPNHYHYIIEPKAIDVKNEYTGELNLFFTNEVLKQYDIVNKPILVSYYFEYLDTSNSILTTDSVNLSYSGIGEPIIETDLDKIKYIPINRTQEVQINTRLSGATIKYVRIEDLGGNPEKIEFGKNIFVMKEHFPIISDSNSSFSLFFKVKKPGIYNVRLYFELDGLLGSIMYKDIKFKALDFDVDMLAFSNSFYVDNNIYHVSLTYMNSKDVLIKIKNISDIPLNIKGISILIPTISKDIYGVSNINVNISYSNITAGSNLNPGEEILLLCNILGRDFGYNIFFIVVDVDIFGKYYLPVTTFVNNNILRNVYVISYNNDYKEFVSVKGVPTVSKIVFKNYGDDACLVRNEALGYDKFNILISEYAFVMPNSITTFDFVYKPKLEGRRQGYIYTELLHQIEAYRIFQSDQTTEYKIFHPGIIHSFISNVVIGEGTLIKVDTLDFMELKTDFKPNLIKLRIKNIGMNPVRITGIDSPNAYNRISNITISNMVVNMSDEATIFIELAENIDMDTNINVLIKYMDINTYVNKVTNIIIDKDDVFRPYDLVFNKNMINFGYINVTQIKEDKLEIFNNTGSNIELKFDYTGSSEIRVPNGVIIILRPGRVFKVPIGLYCLRTGSKSGVLKISYRNVGDADYTIKDIVISGICIDSDYINII